MSAFINNAITDRGRILLADAQSGAIFEATRIVMGSGNMPSSATARSMTAVVAPVVELAINKIERTGDGKVIYGGVYTNETITEAFYFREFALYARVKYPATGEAAERYSDEVLYSYGNAGTSAELMPAYSSNTFVERQMDLVTWVGNDTEITLEISSNLYLTPDNIELYLSEYAKKVWVNGRIDERLETVVIPLIGDVETLISRVDAAENHISQTDADVSAAKAEIAALRENDVEIHAQINTVAAQATAVWDALFNDITDNPALVDFDDLSGITLSGGVWNRPLRRLEV